MNIVFPQFHALYERNLKVQLAKKNAKEHTFVHKKNVLLHFSFSCHLLLIINFILVIQVKIK